MNATRRAETIPKMSGDALVLAEALGCGRETAVQIGKDAKAVVRIGRRTLYNFNAVQRYLDAICTE